MGAETDELKPTVIGLSVDENQIRSNMAIPMVSPVAGQRMIAAAIGQRVIIDEQAKYF
jgi:hypothetical protein